jgi:thiol-disulfide isomerase/thioredoxin
MKQNLTLLLLLCASLLQAQMQTITGRFPQLKSNEIALMGYNGFQEEELARTRCDSTGHFELSYPATYIGAAVLQIKDASNLIVLLNCENFDMQWVDLHDFNTLVFTRSPENDAFAKGIIINQETEQRLAGLKYLLPKYEKYPGQHQWLQQEIVVQEKQFQDFIDQLPKNIYAAKYLQIRKLVTDMSQSTERYPERIPQYETEFKSLNFNDDKLWHSGLMSELFAGFYRLMETYKDIDQVNTYVNPATEAWIKSLSTNPARQQDVAEFCFKVLEMHNQLGASEYMSKTMLDQSGCHLDEKRTNLFEQYRKMAVGNMAPDISLPDGTKLSELNNRYKLVVFGASWCENCQKDYPSLVGRYKRLKEEYNIECVYISIDTEKTTYEDFYSEAPFITYCDLKGWQSQAVKDYYVFATPTYFLLDTNLKILAKIKSPEELDNHVSKISK